MMSSGRTAERERPMNWRWPPGSSISEKARLASRMRRSAEGGTTPGGMVSWLVRVWGGGHGVEAGYKLAQLFCCRVADAMGVVAGGDGFHGVGERLDGAGDLLAEVERKPAAGER